ncbi:hypothetical protein, partial [Dialister hominis]
GQTPKSNQLGSVRKSDKKFYKKFKKYQKIKIGACSCVAGLLLRSKVKGILLRWGRSKPSATARTAIITIKSQRSGMTSEASSTFS